MIIIKTFTGRKAEDEATKFVNNADLKGYKIYPPSLALDPQGKKHITIMVEKEVDEVFNDVAPQGYTSDASL